MAPGEHDADPVAAARLVLPGSVAAVSTPADDAVEAPRSGWASVPWRTIVASIGLVGLTLLLAVVVYRASRVVIWVAVAGFFAVVLARPVRLVEERARLRRGAAIGVVVGAALALSLGVLALFVLPVRTQLVAALTDLPGTVRQAAEGRGPVGEVVDKLHLEQLVRDNESKLTDAARSVQGSMVRVLGTVLQTLLAVVTVAVMTCLMLSQSAALSRAGTRLVPLRHREWVTHVARDAASAISGYMIGNLIISVCAGVAAFALLFVLRVPNAAVLALWVAFADLIPLVGATLGAVVAVLAAFLVSSGAGIASIVFFVLYQQFENSVLQVVVMARTVRVSPLVVLLSVLLGVELFGFVGALLAVPVAGAGSVVVKELWRHRPVDADRLLVVTSGLDEVPRTAVSRSWRRRWADRVRRSRAAGPEAPPP